MLDITAILADPQAYGFAWEAETVKQNGRSYPAMLVRVENVELFATHFKPRALKALNGQSIKVGSQAISRNAHGTLSPEALRERNVKWLLEIEESTPTVKYRCKIDGEWVEFDSEAEADEALANL